MSVYSYEAIDSTGKKIKSSFEAIDKEEVLQMIRDKNMYPIKVEKTALAKEINLPFLNRIQTKDITFFCRQMATLLNAGITLADALEIVKGQVVNKTLKKALVEVSEDVQKGMAFSDALQKQNLFPDLLIHMVAAGEASGTIDNSMTRMAESYEKDYAIQRKVKGAMTYPIVLCIVCIVAVIFVLTSVLPKFTGLFESTGAELPAITQLLIKISNFIMTHGLIILIVLVALIFGFVYFARSVRGRLILDTLKLQFPVIRTLTTKIITARFTRTLSSLLSSGIPLVQAIEFVGGVAGNKVATEKILKVKDEISKGSSLTDAIQRTGIFEPMVIYMMRTGEESGQLDDILEKTASVYEGEVETQIQSMTSLIEPLMIVIMALGVGFIVISIVMPMFDLASTMQR